MLYGEEEYIKEFAEAAIISFEEFSDNYKKFLLLRDETNFRKAGHKIKPATQMLGLDPILDEYEHAKTLIWDKAPDEDLEKSVDKVQSLCKQVLKELKEKLQKAYL